MIPCEERYNIQPVCPHCKTELAQIWFHQLSGILGKKYVYFCSHCRAVLGISHRKGFWMG
jgi:hypothetical protein